MSKSRMQNINPGVTILPSRAYARNVSTGLPPIKPGDSFSGWTVVRRSGQSRGRDVLWLCRCKCDKESPVAGHVLRSGKSTHCRSCGQRERHTHPKQKQAARPSRTMIADSARVSAATLSEMEAQAKALHSWVRCGKVSGSTVEFDRSAWVRKQTEKGTVNL